ncbi:zinc finger protein 732-like isoform X2 [Cydia pomonella]|uniref:zinc finger protein 732-like isoform X2 n=1 Tax=Cydia pomonella TaxID=82600 RepID=UPI002ADD7048|nr:zinc finger protein 732-like isoform X2 [Cydia pomonella]
MQYFVKMYAVKRETEEVLCHGCLSANRSLSPLTNYEMYFCLLGNKQTLEEYKYLNILLCWECQALLRRTQRFRNTLQRAQYLLSVAHTEQVSLKSLSTLTHTHKEEYDCSIEESIAIESKNEVELFIDNSDTHIKEEIEDNLEIDNIDTYSDNIKDENELKIIKTTKKYKKDTEKREFKKLDNGLDMRNPEKYFSEICLSEKEVGEILEREREEDASRPHKCDVCGFWFVSRTDVYDHKKTMHRQRSKPGKCPQCAFPYKSLWDLELHSWRSHPVNRCSLCGRVVASRDKGKHLQMHRFRYRCLKCGADFDNKHWYHHHEKQLHSKYICAHCDRTVNTKKSLEKHVIVPCPECGKVFSRKNYMNNHMKLFHSNQSRHHCPLCDKYFVNGWGLRTHHKFVHEKIPLPKTKICSVCGRGFGTNRVLENHMRTHTGERPFSCARCPAAFAQRVALKAHLAAIHKEK